MDKPTAAQPLDLDKQFEVAINAAYPIPDTPHTSVMQRANEGRGAFAKGWDAALIAQARAARPSVQVNLLNWALREFLGALPERRDWLNPEAESILRAVLDGTDSLARAARLDTTASAEVAAWMTEDGERVVSAATKAGQERDGGASASAMRPYSVPLVRASQSAGAADTTASAELAPLPNTELAARLAEYASNPHYGRDDYVKVMQEASDAIHAVAKWNERRAAQPVQTGAAVDDEMVERALDAFNEFPCPMNGSIARSGNMEQMKAALRASLAPVAAQQAAANSAQIYDKGYKHGLADAAAKAPAAQAVPTNDQITEIATKAFAAGEMSWAGFTKDENDRYMVPVISPMEFGLVRAVVKAIGAASPASTPEASPEQTITIDGRTYTATEIKGRILELMHDVEVLDKLVKNAGREIESAYAQQPAASTGTPEASQQSGAADICQVCGVKRYDPCGKVACTAYYPTEYKQAAAVAAPSDDGTTPAPWEADGTDVINRTEGQVCRCETREDAKLIARLRNATAGAATTSEDARQLAELILADSDGGYMRISSDLEYCPDGAMRFTVTNPVTGRRFGVHLGLAELRTDRSIAAQRAPQQEGE